MRRGNSEESNLAWMKLVVSTALWGGCLTACALPPAAEPTPPLPRFSEARLFATNFATGPDGGAWLVAVADFDGDGFGDVAAVSRSAPGAVHVLQNVRGGKCAPLGEVARDTGAAAALSVLRQPDGRDALLVQSADGGARLVSRAADGAFTVQDSASETLLAPLASLASAPPPQWELPAGAVTAEGDVTGDGVPDLLILRRDSEWRVGGDLLLRAGRSVQSTDQDQDGASDAEETACGSDPLQADSDGDGLLDGWELHGEGGLDLPALGANPNRQDCVAYLQCIGAVDEAAVHAEIERAIQTWAALPVTNRNGVSGIGLHVVWLPSLGEEAVSKSWWQNADEQMPKAAKGLAHYMQVTPGGGGQAAELGDAGGCGANALWATFLHEFGHQVGLSHSGGALPGMCPIYTSLMNYAYSYGFEDDYGKIHYSTGSNSSLELNETCLSERLERPLAEVAFLAHGPFAFKLQEEADGVLIDWNRNGKFENEPVRADVSDVYGADGGIRHGVGKTVFAPCLVEHRGRLWVFSVTRELVLQARVARAEEGSFEDPMALTQVQATGDPWAASNGTQLLLFVPTASGVAVLAAEDPADLVSAPIVWIPSSAGAQVSAFSRGESVCALLWRDASSPVSCSQRKPEGGWSEPLAFAELRSSFAPAAVTDPGTDELVVGYGSESADGSQRAWHVARFRDDDASQWVLQSDRIVGGPTAGWYGNSRPVLLIENQPDHPAPGRLHFIARGYTTPPETNGCWYEAITIGDTSQSDGWRLRRWYDEWTTSRSPVGAAFHGNDLVLAYRWCGNVHGDEDEDLHVAFHGFGVRDEIMKDYDDVSAISRVGLSRSIPWRDPVQN